MRFLFVSLQLAVAAYACWFAYDLFNKLSTFRAMKRSVLRLVVVSAIHLSLISAAYDTFNASWGWVDAIENTVTCYQFNADPLSVFTDGNPFSEFDNDSEAREYTRLSRLCK